MISPFDLIVKRVVAKGLFMNHPDIEPKIPAALNEAIPLVASGAIQLPITSSADGIGSSPSTAQRGDAKHLACRGHRRGPPVTTNPAKCGM
jgi:hypothetical protein